MDELVITDTHCHIQQIVGPADEPVHQKWAAAGLDGLQAAGQVISEARQAGVSQLICVGCDLPDSQLAVDFVQDKPGLWASIGIHPHEAQRYQDDEAALERFAALAVQPKVVAVGECGLDYFYEHSPREAQIALLRFQFEVAIRAGLPMIFHVREAFDDFWPIFDEYAAQAALTGGRGLRGVIHSFSADQAALEQILARGLYVGLNGIQTFTKNPQQTAAAKAVPRDKLLIETDAPYLTPTPYRGKICVPKHARTNLEFVAQLQGTENERVEPVQPSAGQKPVAETSVRDLADATTANARRLFNLV